MGEVGTTEYAIKQVGDRYYPVIIDKEAGGHYEIKNPMTGGILSYNNPEAAEKYIQRARENNCRALREAPYNASAAQRKPELPVELSGVLELRAATL